jgi:hypothetical protein
MIVFVLIQNIFFCSFFSPRVREMRKKVIEKQKKNKRKWLVFTILTTKIVKLGVNMFHLITKI